MIAICMVDLLLGQANVLRYWSGETPEASNEVAAHGFRGSEPAPCGDHRDGVVGLLELTAGRLGADPLDVGARRLADLLGEHPGEVPRAHRGAAGQLGTLCAPPGSASMASCTSRIGVRRARGIHTGAANWVCPPGRAGTCTS